MRLMITVLLVCLSKFAWSCSCSSPTLIEKIENSESIIIGNIVQVKDLQYFKDLSEYGDRGVQIIVQVEESLKGKKEDQVTLYSSYNGGECGISSNISAKYLFFLDNDRVSSCEGHILYQYYDRESFSEKVNEVKRLVDSGI